MKNASASSRGLIPGLRHGLAAIAVLSSAIASAESLHHQVHIEGAGPSTVVFESGFGDTLEIWQNIQPRIADHCVRTFSYTRAGYVGSDAPDSVRDATTIVGELREELLRHNVAPPYVLVGHSLGGLYMQYFARNFPADVTGLVLIDSTHWKQGMKLDPTANTPYQARTAVTLYMPLIMRHELSDSAAAGLEVNTSPNVTGIPTIVLSSTRLPSGETAEQRAEAVTQQDEIAADFPGAQHTFVPDSGHYIQRDQPGVVVNAIRELAGCEQKTLTGQGGIPSNRASGFKSSTQGAALSQ
jgi:pimeloyl-ACP methyl ester carboxylesterase